MASKTRILASNVKKHSNSRGTTSRGAKASAQKAKIKKTAKALDTRKAVRHGVAKAATNVGMERHALKSAFTAHPKPSASSQASAKSATSAIKKTASAATNTARKATGIKPKATATGMRKEKRAITNQTVTKQKVTNLATAKKKKPLY